MNNFSAENFQRLLAESLFEYDVSIAQLFCFFTKRRLVALRRLPFCGYGFGGGDTNETVRRWRIEKFNYGECESFFLVASRSLQRARATLGNVRGKRRRSRISRRACEWPRRRWRRVFVCRAKVRRAGITRARASDNNKKTKQKTKLLNFSFCPNPCCGFSAASICAHEICAAAGRSRRCFVSAERNRNLVGLVANEWNVSCACDEAGRHFRFDVERCVDVDECATTAAANLCNTTGKFDC